MNSLRCGCELSAGARTAISGPPPSRLLRRFRHVAGWLIPSGILALLPKCPACIAAYIALASGIGISTAAAFYLRASLVTVCVASLIYFSVTYSRRLIRASASHTPRPASKTP